MDPTSRELLDLIIERIRSMPLLLIVTFRPEFQPPWTGQEQVSTLALNRLDRHDRRALVEQIGDGKALPDNVVAQIAERTDGVPLFVEELTKNVLESGLLRVEADRYVLDGALPAFAIPTSLHASLLGRLDRLGSVRDVAQIAAAIGRQFPYTLLRAACRLPEDELQGSLARLVRVGLTKRDATRSGLCIQACAGTRRGVRQPIAQCPPAVACADRRCARNPLPRGYRKPARAPRTALRRGRAH